MSYTETTQRSWGDRIKGAFGGVIVGIVLFLAGTFLLYWNEGRTVKTGGAINEAKLVTVAMPDISKVDPAFSGKLVHAFGQAVPQGEVVDPIFGVSLNAIRLSRKTQYYQWVEHSKSETRKKVGGGEETVTTYTYKKEWTSKPVDSSQFRDPKYRQSFSNLAAQGITRALIGGDYALLSEVGANFVLARFDDETFYAPEVSFGAYKLSESQKRGVGGSTPLTLSISAEQKKSIFERLDPNLIRKPALAPASSDEAPEPENKLIHVENNTVYVGLTPGSPRIGDVKVTFEHVPPAEITIIAQVVGDTFEEFTASNGYTFSRLNMGKVGIEKMFADAKTENTVIAWVLRVVGTLLVIIGLGKVLAPLSVLADVIPILGTLVGVGTGLVSFLLGLAWSLLVIAIAWLRFRPVLAGSLIAVSVVLALLPAIRARKQRQAA
ncbi:MAG: primosome assembly protein PriA [Fretibacterium sp.]|nr:primosome assembly protein PriA [Fretibacterium sp.]